MEFLVERLSNGNLSSGLVTGESEIPPFVSWPRLVRFRIVRLCPFLVSLAAAFLLSGCTRALPSPDPAQIAYGTAETVREELEKIKEYAAECDKELEHARQMYSRIAQLEQKVSELEQKRLETDKLLQTSKKKSRACVAKYSKFIKLRKQQEDPEYSPSDAPPGWNAGGGS